MIVWEETAGKRGIGTNTAPPERLLNESHKKTTECNHKTKKRRRSRKREVQKFTSQDDSSKEGSRVQGPGHVEKKGQEFRRERKLQQILLREKKVVKTIEERCVNLPV